MITVYSLEKENKPSQIRQRDGGAFFKSYSCNNKCMKGVLIDSRGSEQALAPVHFLVKEYHN